MESIRYVQRLVKEHTGAGCLHVCVVLSRDCTSHLHHDLSVQSQGNRSQYPICHSCNIPNRTLFHSQLLRPESIADHLLLARLPPLRRRQRTHHHAGEAQDRPLPRWQWRRVSCLGQEPFRVSVEATGNRIRPDFRNRQRDGDRSCHFCPSRRSQPTPCSWATRCFIRTTCA